MKVNWAEIAFSDLRYYNLEANCCSQRRLRSSRFARSYSEYLVALESTHRYAARARGRAPSQYSKAHPVSSIFESECLL
jgi:hypothetical protein